MTTLKERDGGDLDTFHQFSGDVIMLHPSLAPFITQSTPLLDEHSDLPTFKTSSMLGSVRIEICNWYAEQWEEAKKGLRKYDHVVIAPSATMRMPGGGHADILDRLTGFAFLLEYPSGTKVRYIMISSVIDALASQGRPDFKLECQICAGRIGNKVSGPDFAAKYRLRYGEYPATA